jgi:hypothetical protein
MFKMNAEAEKIVLSHSEHERIATECVCCKSKYLKKSPAILMPFIADRVFGWKPVEIDDSWGLKTIKNGNAYSICNSLYCINCGFLFLDIRFSEAELNSLYDDYRGQGYTDLREIYEPGYKAKNDSLLAGINYIAVIETFLNPYLSFPIRMLDWGGDTGKNTPFKEKNNLFHLFDIGSKPVVDGAKVVDKNTALSTKYDLIVCSNVLEHVPYPAELILDMKKAMGKETVLYIEVPLEDIVRLSEPHADLSLMKKHWHEHINFYSENSLLQMLNHCGLKVLELKKLNASAGGSSAFLIQIACKKVLL